MKAKIVYMALAMVLVFSLAAVVVPAGPAMAATTYTVDDDWQIGAPPYAEDTDGDNDFATIQAAINAASSGDTVYVRSGTYYEHVTIGKSLTLQGEDKDTTAIDGGGSGNVIYITANYVTISGFKVTNGDYGIYLIANWTIHHVTIRDVVITSISKDAFHAPHSGGYHLIEDCIISNNGRASYAHQFGNSIIRNCEVFDNGGALSVAWGSGTLITNNRVHHNADIGIDFDSMSDSVIENNEVYNNNGDGIALRYVAEGDLTP
ncbi:MAG: right-handed parallel beta-helix repeat-containing protein [Dehalococcoidia bacterium]|nr:right-handed parallel beta-helix repeat-containing protein [Dehalococcoidia bacterium]